MASNLTRRALVRKYTDAIAAMDRWDGVNRDEYEQAHKLATKYLDKLEALGCRTYDCPIIDPNYYKHRAPMKKKFAEWIAEHVLNPVGKCDYYAPRMAEHFGSLRLAKGTVEVEAPGGPETGTHWWCVDTTTGKVVDPTASQFLRVIKYNEIKATVIGRCRDCGEYTTTESYSADFCTQEHADSYVKYLQEGIHP